VICLSSVTASAQENPLKRKPSSPAARAHLEQGNRLYRILEYDKAIEEYKAGAAIEGHEIFYYNLAQAYRMTLRYAEAIPLYEQWLARAQPSGALRAAVEKHIESMRAELQKQASRRLPLGPAPDEPQADDKSMPTTETGRVDEDDGHGDLLADPWYADATGWIVAGTGTVSLGVGLGFLVSASNLQSDADAEDRQLVRQELRDRAEDRTIAGAIVGSVGIALLSAGIIKLAITDQQRHWSSVQSHLLLDRNLVGFVVGGKF